MQSTVSSVKVRHFVHSTMHHDTVEVLRGYDNIMLFHLYFSLFTHKRYLSEKNVNIGFTTHPGNPCRDLFFKGGHKKQQHKPDYNIKQFAQMTSSWSPVSFPVSSFEGECLFSKLWRGMQCVSYASNIQSDFIIYHLLAAIPKIWKCP